MKNFYYIFAIKKLKLLKILHTSLNFSLLMFIFIISKMNTCSLYEIYKLNFI